MTGAHESKDDQLQSPNNIIQAEERPAPESLIGKLIGLVKQSGRYLIVGFSSAAIEIGLYALLHEFFGLEVDLSFFGIHFEVINVTALVTATVYNFILNRTWTFNPTRSLARSIILFLILFAFNSVFSSTVIFLLAGVGIPYVLAKIFTIACIVCWNFFLYRFVVFK